MANRTNETFDFIPNSFMTPNDFVDKLMYLLTNPEFRCLIYADRRILGFNKRQDCISISQFVSGTRRNDGSFLDHGTGMSRQSVMTALDRLEKIGLLVKISENDSRVNKGAEYALQLDGSKIDIEFLVSRHQKWQKDNEQKMTQARQARTEVTPSNQQTGSDPVYPLDGGPSNQQTGGRLTDRPDPVYTIDTQYPDLNPDLNPENSGREPAPAAYGGNGIIKNPGAFAALQSFERNKGAVDYSIYPEDVREVVRVFCDLFSARPPARSRKQGGEYAQWISGARELSDACGEFGLDALTVARDALAGMPIEKRYPVAWPGAALKLTRAAAIKLRQKSSARPEVDTFEQFDEKVFYLHDRHATQDEYQGYLRNMGAV